MARRTVAGMMGMGLGLSLQLDASAAGRRSQESTLTRIEVVLGETKTRTDALDLDYRSRGGLLGGEDAEQRYQEGVYLYMIGEDEPSAYEPAAMNFYALVQSGALADIYKHQDAEWYLAESLYGMGNYGIAADFYQSISNQGSSHIKFEDAVIKLLYVHTLLDDDAAFVDVYERYIVSGRVEQTDLLSYTLGKSFYKRGEYRSAKFAFEEIGLKPGAMDEPLCQRAARVSADENEYLGRACYFMGVINTIDDDEYLETAAKAFEVVAGIEGQDPRVTEQAILALARIAKEEGDYTTAASFYQQVPNDSDLLDVKLYELIYTYVDQGLWAEALRDVDIFLTAFPDHRLAAQLRLLKGNLHMKKADDSEPAHKAPERERAHNAYLDLRERSTPVKEMLGDVAASRGDLEQIFQNVVEEVDVYESNAYALPAYAVEMLIGNEDVERVVLLSRDMDQQDQDVTKSMKMLEEVQQALDVSDRSVGTFNKGRRDLTRVRDDVIYIQHQVLVAELEFLESRIDGPAASGLNRIWMDLNVLEERQVEVLGEDREGATLSAEEEGRLSSIQRETSEIERSLRETESEMIVFQRRLDLSRSEMSEEDIRQTEDSLDALGSELEEQNETLRTLRAEADRIRIQASVGLGSSSETDRQRDLLMGDYAEIRDKLRRYRTELSGADVPDITGRIDGIWVSAAKLDSRAKAIRLTLEATEGTELAKLEKTLAEQVAKMGVIEVDFKVTNRDVDVLATDVTGAGFASLENELYHVIMDADRGIAEVFWVRKTEVNTRIKELLEEQARRKVELEERFSEIEKTLEEQ
jgi:TolA-binding protein